MMHPVSDTFEPGSHATPAPSIVEYLWPTFSLMMQCAASAEPATWSPR